MATRKATGKKRVAKKAPLDPVELTIRQKTAPDKLFLPQAVNRSVVTMEEVSSILQDIHIPMDIEQRISGEKSKNMAKVSLSDELLDSGVVTGQLGTFQRAVLEATLSQLMAGNNSFTSAMLYRTMTGRQNTESVSQEQQKMVDDAMNQLMFTPLDIDLRLHIENIDIEGDGRLRGPIVPAEQITMNVAGNTCTAYQITNLPIIYRFCLATNGLTMTPIALLSINNMSYTKRNLAILNYLQRSIAPLIYPAEGDYSQPKPLIIYYENIYEVAQEEGEVTKASSIPIFKKRVRETVKRILDEWVDGKYLARWENINEKREFVACKLFFPKKAPPELPGEPIKRLSKGAD